VSIRSHISRFVAALTLLVAVVAGMIVVAPQQASADGEVDGIAGAPATETGPDTSRSRLTYQLDPGQHIEDRYYVRNAGTTVQDVSIYPTDAFTDQDGAYSLLDSATPPADVGTWVTFDGGAKTLQLTLNPGEIRIIPFTMTVPADARPGDHAGGLIVSALSASGQVQLDRRVATRLYARVKGDLQTGLSITSISSSYDAELNPFAGRTSLTYTVTNTGNVSLGANVVSRVRGIFGIPLSGTEADAVPELLPGETRTITSTVTGVGQWLYLNPTIDLVATIDADALNPGPLPNVQRDTTLFVVPWMFLALLVLGALVWLVLRRRRSVNDKRAAAWIEHTEAEARRNAQGIAQPATGGASS
jgi:hypothetical protein